VEGTPRAVRVQKDVYAVRGPDWISARRPKQGADPDFFTIKKKTHKQPINFSRHFSVSRQKEVLPQKHEYISQPEPSNRSTYETEKH